MNGDGWVDVLFANAFNTDVALPLHQPGRRPTPASSRWRARARGLTTALSSGSAQFGDLDDDGDLDLDHATTPTSAAPAGKPHLFINDGTGHFTENAAALNAPDQVAPDGRAARRRRPRLGTSTSSASPVSNTGGNHYLMLNDGSGELHRLLVAGPATRRRDLRGRGRRSRRRQGHRPVLRQLAGFQEGRAKTSTTAWPLPSRPGTPLAGRPRRQRDRAHRLRQRRRLRRLVGSLGSTRAPLAQRRQPRVHARQRGHQLQASSTRRSTARWPTSTTTARYDLVTVQGESGTFTNKFFLNTGAADMLPPVVAIREPPPRDPDRCRRRARQGARPGPRRLGLLRDRRGALRDPAERPGGERRHHRRRLLARPAPRFSRARS